VRRLEIVLVPGLDGGRRGWGELRDAEPISLMRWCPRREESAARDRTRGSSGRWAEAVLIASLPLKSR
jgi:hypothetical protein